MKRFIFSALLASLATIAGAQTMSDALTYSTSNYYGTARTMGMGNAVTAVGGDLGTICINPAGGSVAGYSQFAFSMGLTTSSAESSYASSYNTTTNDPVWISGFKDSRTRFTLPGAGINLRFDTGESDGILSWNFGFLYNRSQTFTSSVAGGGLNQYTTMTGALADAATSAAMAGTAYDDNSAYDNWPWNPLVAYRGGLINYNDDAGTYYGSGEFKDYNAVTNEYSYTMLGKVRQSFGYTVLGSRNDMVFNWGMDINDRVFVGANLSVPIINYRYGEFYSEVVPDDEKANFTIAPEWMEGGVVKTGANTVYLGSNYKYDYRSDVSGVNLKLGVIWLPTDGLRLGAAIQTPTAYSIHERWYVSASSRFEASDLNASETSPLAEADYSFVAPYVFNAGAAFTFGRFGMISADYELTDFSIMEFSPIDEDDLFGPSANPYYKVNRLNELFCGVSHSLRLGMELRPTPYLAVRAGFNLTTSPVRSYMDTDGFEVDANEYDIYFDDFENGVYQLIENTKKYSSDKTVSYSLGLGYISSGAFYADFALRRTSLPSTNYSPYSNYIWDSNAGQTYMAPTLHSKNRLVDAVLTLGWRF